jgi:hypothetical protein
MSGSNLRIALYTTVYPGVETYLPEWYRSLQAQTDQHFHLWIGLDGIAVETVLKAIGANVKATWVPSQPGDTPARVRQRSLEKITETYDAVVLVDSDDLLHDTRVAAAREAIENADLAGCALRLVNEEGQELGLTLGLPPQSEAADVLPRHNVFGFSNTAFRSKLLERCLPVPADVALMDWFLATKAWLMGAKLSFDSVVRMDYRQHATNMARVRFPVSPEQVAGDTELVRRHFQFILAEDPGNFLCDRWSQVKCAAAGIEAFHECVVCQPGLLRRYTEVLNRLNPATLWWMAVAHPELESMWQTVTRTNYESC